MSEYRISMSQYKHLVIRKVDGDEVYNVIKKHIDDGNSVVIDFNGIDTMTTFFAKQVFGKLYIELGQEKFSNFVKFEKKNMTDDIDLVLRIGIAGAISQL